LNFKGQARKINEIENRAASDFFPASKTMKERQMEKVEVELLCIAWEIGECEAPSLALSSKSKYSAFSVIHCHFLSGFLAL